MADSMSTADHRSVAGTNRVWWPPAGVEALLLAGAVAVTGIAVLLRANPG